MARELYTYKKSEIRLDIRQQRTVGLAAVLWRWLSIHEIHVAQAAHTPKFSVITSVPSTNGRVGEHPLKHLVSSIVSGSDDRYADLLEPQSTSSDREADRARFRTTKSVHNASVLVIDDTWTTGARAQSAAAALKLGGASRVGFVAIGRWFRVDYENNAAWLAHVRRRAWSWDRCCLE
jgi:predicted amidophosphoribosyltransferase